jgi:hypothetical protein
VVVGVAWMFRGHRLTSRSGGEVALFDKHVSSIDKARPAKTGSRLELLSSPHNPRIADREGYLLAAQRQRMYERQRDQLDWPIVR